MNAPTDKMHPLALGFLAGIRLNDDDLIDDTEDDDTAGDLGDS